MTALDRLIEAYKGSDPPQPLVIDNDRVHVYQGGRKVFEAHPGELLQDLLDRAGIPWEPA